jgi:hypothetical protein
LQELLQRLEKEKNQLTINNDECDQSLHDELQQITSLANVVTKLEQEKIYK